MRNEVFWNDIPVGKENAVSYVTLCACWGVNKRTARAILHNLSLYDNGDNYILIRSSKNGGGFYKTDDPEELKAFKKECLNKGRSNFAPVKKINRVLNSLSDDLQVSFFNNLRTARLTAGLKQEDVVKEMQRFDARFNVAILSRFENGICLPTPYQLAQLARIYGVQPHELVRMDDNALELFAN